MEVKLMDILTVRKGIICHQINPYAMGAGLALAIRKKWPVHYKDFEDWKKYRSRTLGEVIFSYPYEWDDFVIAGMCAQPRYGPRTQCWTDYDALRECLDKVSQFAQEQEDGPLEVFIPWKIGCGLGGGRWEDVQRIIAHQLPDAILCKLGG